MLSNEDYLHIFHEIKNSIALINSSLQLVEKKHPEVREFDYWNESMSELCFLKNMVIQLSSARLFNHLNLMQVNIYSFMHQIDTSIRVLSWKNFVCNFQLEENLPLIELDPQLLKQAVINIIKNAFEAMHESGTTDVHVFYEEPFMSIAILTTAADSTRLWRIPSSSLLLPPKREAAVWDLSLPVRSSNHTTVH